VKISIDLVYHCGHLDCDQYFRARAPLQAVLDQVPVVPELPPGWALEDKPTAWGEVEVALKCRHHRRDAATVVVDNRIMPTPEIVGRARRLQALALDPGATPNEQDNAWAAFQKLWEKYKLPEDLGIERR
jgi:hypothetical protein